MINPGWPAKDRGNKLPIIRGEQVADSACADTIRVRSAAAGPTGLRDKLDLYGSHEMPNSWPIFSGYWTWVWIVLGYVVAFFFIANNTTLLDSLQLPG